ncbi:MAG: hypothetical protein ACYTGC_05305, partial [Planctomycetota bacterium]
MDLPRMRPTFDLTLGVSAEEAIAALRAHLRASDCPVDHQSAGDHFHLMMPQARRHFWSPW